MKSRHIFSCLSAFCLVTSPFVHAETQSISYEEVESLTQYPILTPTLSGRKTAKIKLSNGMQAYLISDPDVEQSAAAITTQAGSWQDPKEYPGMAHFLEHMLFMGNEAYPNESEYSQYIQDNGGTYNAFTAPDRTVYMFAINNKAFTGALDRFSHFFIDPLFNPSCINRELLAVDQEHSKNIEHDGWRELMVLKETGNQDHPNRQFSTGNASTLSGIPQEALKNWYQKYYSANKMHLILLSSLSLDEMTTLVQTHFSGVSSKGNLDPSDESGFMLSDKQKGHFIYIKPIKDLKTLSLTWELPKEFASIDEKWTAELVSYALEQASDQSLIQELKKEGLAEALSASTDRFGGSNLLFQMSVKLTEKGLSQMDTVILRCYQALARLKQNGLPLSLFQEMQTMSLINYQYQSRQEPFDWISHLAYDIVEEPLATFPEKTSIPSHFDPQSLMQFINTLTPQSCVYFVQADPEKTGVETGLKEKWMGVSYTVKPILSSKLTAWEQAGLNPNIQIPPSNPFIPTSLKLANDSKKSTKKSIIPSLLVEEDKAEIYFAADEDYLIPEVDLLFHLKSPTLDGSAKSSVYMDLFSKSLKEQLSSTLFFAGHAGLSSSFFHKKMRFSIEIAGYSEKAPQLAEMIFDNLKDVTPSEEYFEIYKKSLLASYSNAACELPVKQALETLSYILLNDAPTSLEKIQALESISFEEFSSFCKTWLSQVYLEGMIYGNLSEFESKELSKSLLSKLSDTKPYLTKEQRKLEVLVLPENKGPFKIVQKTDRQGYSTILALQEGSFSFSKKSSQQILSNALKESFFETLRTKQQTGYLTTAWASEMESQLMQNFAVQSNSHSSEDLLARFEIFLEDFNKRVEEIISEDRFNHLKQAQIASLEVPPENLHAMAGRLDALAFDHSKDFKRIEKRIQSLKDLSYQEFLLDAKDFLSKENFRRVAVLVEGKPITDKPLQYQTITEEEIRRLGTFTPAEETL